MAKILHPENSALVRQSSTMYGTVRTGREKVFRDETDLKISQLLDELKIGYQYRTPIITEDSVLIPEFTLDGSGKKFFVEIRGPVEDDLSRSHWSRKEEFYRRMHAGNHVILEENDAVLENLRVALRKSGLIQ